MVTERQDRLVRYIAAYQDRHQGVSPSIREMAAALGYRVGPGGLHSMLTRIESQGAIRRRKYQERAIEVLKRPPPRIVTWKGERYRYISSEELAP